MPNRILTAGLLVFVAGGVSADTPLWVDSDAARPWLPALTRAADATGLPVPLIAELVGIESGFQTVKNKRSTAFGCGQQINNNPWMRAHKLDRKSCADSIMGAALQFSDALRRTGSIAGAAKSYGTTAGLSPAKRNRIIARLDAAMRPNAKVTVVAAAPRIANW